MKALEEKILCEGTVLPGNILKVGSFLNHQIDVDFLMEMGREIARLFADAKVTKVFTIETSGIPVAMATAAAMHVPMVYAKKHKSGNLSGDLYTTVVHPQHGLQHRGEQGLHSARRQSPAGGRFLGQRQGAGRADRYRGPGGREDRGRKLRH